MTRNLSRGGLFALTLEEPPEGSIVGLEVVFQGTRLHAKAEVIKRTDEGLGLRFVDADEAFGTAVRTLMDSLVAGQTRDADQLESADDPPPLRVSWSYPDGRRDWRFWRKQRVTAKAVNLTLDGASLRSSERPPVGDTILVYLERRHNTADEPLVCEAEVARHTDEGFAVRFSSPSIAFRRAVSDARRSKFRGA